MGYKTPHYGRRRPAPPGMEIPQQLEEDLQRDVLRFLQYMGVMADTTHTPNSSRGRQPTEYKARADIRGILPSGRALVLELKRPGEKPDQDQLDYLQRAREHNALAFWADSLKTVEVVVKAEIEKGHLAAPPWLSESGSARPL